MVHPAIQWSKHDPLLESEIIDIKQTSAKPESSDIERSTIHSSTILGAPWQSQVKPTETRGHHRICVQDGKLSQ